VAETGVWGGGKNLEEEEGGLDGPRPTKRNVCVASPSHARSGAKELPERVAKRNRDPMPLKSAHESVDGPACTTGWACSYRFDASYWTTIPIRRPGRREPRVAHHRTCVGWLVARPGRASYFCVRFSFNFIFLFFYFFSFPFFFFGLVFSLLFYNFLKIFRFEIFVQFRNPFNFQKLFKF
jgi:hypothetical protein